MPVGGEPLEQVADPADALRVQAVHRLVEDERLGVGQQRGRDPQPLPHTEGEAARPFAGHVLQPDHLDDVGDALFRDAVGGGESQQVVVRGPGRVDRACFEQGTDDLQWSGVLA